MAPLLTHATYGDFVAPPHRFRTRHVPELDVLGQPLHGVPIQVPLHDAERLCGGHFSRPPRFVVRLVRNLSRRLGSGSSRILPAGRQAADVWTDACQQLLVAGAGRGEACLLRRLGGLRVPGQARQ